MGWSPDIGRKIRSNGGFLIPHPAVVDPKRKSARPTVAAAIQAKADMRIVAFTTEASPVQRILTHIGEPAEPPPIAPARGPPVWDDGPDSLPDWDSMAQQEPEYMFNQEVHW